MGFREQMADANQKLRDQARDLKAEEAAAREYMAANPGASRQQALSVLRNPAVPLTGQTILFSGASHEDGRNSKVTLFADRLERVKAKKFSSLSSASQGAEVTPMRAISSVETKKDGILFTKVTVYASGNNIEFRFSHADADRFKSALMAQILKPSTPSPASVPAAKSKAEQIREIAALRDEGILSDEEFQSEKTKLLSS